MPACFDPIYGLVLNQLLPKDCQLVLGYELLICPDSWLTGHQLVNFPNRLVPYWMGRLLVINWWVNCPLVTAPYSLIGRSRHVSWEGGTVYPSREESWSQSIVALSPWRVFLWNTILLYPWKGSILPAVLNACIDTPTSHSISTSTMAFLTMPKTLFHPILLIQVLTVLDSWCLGTPAQLEVSCLKHEESRLTDEKYRLNPRAVNLLRLSARVAPGVLKNVGEEVDDAPLQLHHGQKVLGSWGKEVGRQVLFFFWSSTLFSGFWHFHHSQIQLVVGRRTTKWLVNCAQVFSHCLWFHSS